VFVTKNVQPVQEKEEFMLGMVIQFQRAQFYLRGEKRVTYNNRKSNAVFFFFSDLECYGHHSMRGKN
jgi:hypothetical protein